MSIQYAALKAACRVVPLQKLMAMPYEKLMKLFGTEKAKPDIPALSDTAFSFKTVQIDGFPVLMMRHRKPSQYACIYVIGGGMLKYPRPSQAKEVLKLARNTGRDFILPYFPLCPDHDLFDVLNMLHDTYAMVLQHYRAENTAFLGSSSGASMTLWLISYINHDKKDLPMPGKIYLSSPGSAMEPAERKKAEELNRKDLIMSTAALDNIFKGMAGGRPLPDYLSYNGRGIYTGIRDVYLTYGGDEIFSAAAGSTSAGLHSYGADVRMEIGVGMYHVYAAMPLIPEAEPAYERMIHYLKV